MNVNQQQNELYLVLVIEEEEITTMNSSELKEEIQSLGMDSTRNIIMDLSNVNFVDSSGISAFINAYQFCKSRNGSFVMVNLHPHVSKVIHISQLDSILTMLPTREEAHDYIQMEELTRQITEES